MPFPFYWIGAFVAGAFLSLVLTLFALALRFLTRTTSEVRGSILPGLVSGFRDWAGERNSIVRRIVSPGGSEPGDGIEEALSSAVPPVERLRPHLR
jgi:hypothetical protein